MSGVGGKGVESFDQSGGVPPILALGRGAEEG